MDMYTAPAEAEVIELAAAKVYFVNGVHRVDHVGNGMMLITYFRNDVISDGHGEATRLIELKMLIHAADIPAARQVTTAALNRVTMPHASIQRLLM